MIEQEKIIQIFISTGDVRNEKDVYHYIVSGIDNLHSVIDCLHFNGEDCIYIHLNSAISSEEISDKLNILCKVLKEKKLVDTARFSRMGNSIEDGSRYDTTFGDNNMLVNDRYFISFTR